MIYKPLSTEGKDFLETIKKNEEQLYGIDREAKEKNQLVGRYIQEPYADGYAVYQVIRENKNTVRVRVCTGLGDDWVIPYWGEEYTINKEYAIQSIKSRDNIKRVFEGK